MTILNFKLQLLEIELSLAAVLSDFDRKQGRQRDADGKWTASTPAMSDGDKLSVFLDDKHQIFKADSPERQKLIAEVAKDLSVANRDKQDKILKELAPALSRHSDGLTAIAYDERQRAISDLDRELHKLMPDRQANRIVTDLLLDTDEIDFKAIWDEAETTALVDLEATLQNIVAHSAPETPAQKVKGAVKDTFKKISKAVWLNFLPARDEAELYEKTELHIHIKRSKQLQEVGENAKKLLDDIASISIAGFESSIQMLSKLEIDKKANTASEIAQQVAKESRETFGRTVKFFQENAEAYYATRSAEGEKQRKEIEKIVEKAKQKNAAMRNAN